MTRNQIPWTNQRLSRCLLNPLHRKSGLRLQTNLSREAGEETISKSITATRAGMGGEFLVPILFGPACEYALDIAIDMARATGAAILLTHVAERSYGEGFLESEPQKRARLDAITTAEKRLAELAHAKRDANVPIRWVVKTGLPSFEILRLAESKNAKAIVLARTPRSLLSRMLVGSVGSDIIECSPRPVLVINNDGGRGLK